MNHYHGMCRGSSGVECARTASPAITPRDHSRAAVDVPTRVAELQIGGTEMRDNQPRTHVVPSVSSSRSSRRAILAAAVAGAVGIRWTGFASAQEENILTAAASEVGARPGAAYAHGAAAIAKGSSTGVYAAGDIGGAGSGAGPGDSSGAGPGDQSGSGGGGGSGGGTGAGDGSGGNRG